MSSFLPTQRQSPLPSRLVASVAALLLGVLLVVMSTSPVAAAVRVGLGTAGVYAVLAGETVTNTGASVLNGNLGVSPGTATPGFPPGMVNGETHAADAVAASAKDDLVIAYDNAAGQPTDVTVTADLADQTLVPGVYSGNTLALNGQLTLDGANETDPVFIFQTASTLLAGPGSSIVFINGADACDVYWQVGSSATIETGSAFAGTVMALTSITANTGATVQGRLLARNGQVSLQTNTITVPQCSDAPAPTTDEPTATSPEPTTPEPTTPEPTTPEPTTPEPTTPEPTTPEPSTPQPTSPAPSTQEPTPTTPVGPGDGGNAGPGDGGDNGPGDGGDNGGGAGRGGDGGDNGGGAGNDGNGGDAGNNGGDGAFGANGSGGGGSGGEGSGNGQVSPLPVGGVQTGGSPAPDSSPLLLLLGVGLAMAGLGGLILGRRNTSKG